MLDIYTPIRGNLARCHAFADVIVTVRCVVAMIPVRGKRAKDGTFSYRSLNLKAHGVYCCYQHVKSQTTFSETFCIHTYFTLE